jgi:hypothetical protein
MPFEAAPVASVLCPNGTALVVARVERKQSPRFRQQDRSVVSLGVVAELAKKIAAHCDSTTLQVIVLCVILACPSRLIVFQRSYW